MSNARILHLLATIEDLEERIETYEKERGSFKKSKARYQPINLSTTIERQKEHE